MLQLISYRLIDVNGDLKQIFDFMSTNSLTTDVFPNTAEAFKKSSEYAKNRLNQYVSGGEPLDGIDEIEKPFSPQKIRYSENQYGFTLDLNAESGQLSKLQKGQKESDFDMKTKYPYGRKSRVSSKGIPYLIIPFRWGAGKKAAHFNSFIPQVEYQTMAKPMKLSQTKFELIHYEPNAKGEMIARAGYKWGSRLKNAWHKNAEGMVRMRDVRGSSYFTFRIISAKSPKNSWIRHYDNIPPIDIQSAWARTVEPVFISEAEKGILADLGMKT